MLCVSPDAASNPVLYWLGSYAAGRFDLASAAGPFRLDLGDVLYAPNIMTDGQGRQLLWGWLQVRRSGGAPDETVLGCFRWPWPAARAWLCMSSCRMPQLDATGACRSTRWSLV